MTLAPEVVYLTHFGRVGNPLGAARELHRLIDAYVEIATRHRDAGAERHMRIRNDLFRLMLGEVSAMGGGLPADQLRELVGGDIEINAQGLGVWLDSASLRSG